MTDKEIYKQILDYDAHMTEVETLVNELRHFRDCRMDRFYNYRSDLLLTSNQVDIILDALKQVYGDSQ